MKSKEKNIRILVSSDPDYKDLIAEIEFEGEFFCLVSQDKGIDALEIQIAPRKDGTPWNISEADLFLMLDMAKKRLWELRKVGM
jgi:hypothetical protein